MHLIKLLMAFGVFYSTVSFAQTATGNFNANSTLTSTCKISASNASFGAVDYSLPFDSFGISQSTTANVSVQCTNKTPYTVSGGTLITEGTSVSYTMKGALSGNTDKLYYNIWLSPGYSRWFAEGKHQITEIGDGNNQAHNLYLGLYTRNRGRVTPDSYMDNLTLTLTY